MAADAPAVSRQPMRRLNEIDLAFFGESTSEQHGGIEQVVQRSKPSQG